MAFLAGVLNEPLSSATALVVNRRPSDARRHYCRRRRRRRCYCCRESRKRHGRRTEERSLDGVVPAADHGRPPRQTGR